jgi:hypothetical protein
VLLAPRAKSASGQPIFLWKAQWASQGNASPPVPQQITTTHTVTFPFLFSAGSRSQDNSKVWLQRQTGIWLHPPGAWIQSCGSFVAPFCPPPQGHSGIPCQNLFCPMKSKVCKLF